jgi:hypothetical protein
VNVLADILAEQDAPSPDVWPSALGEHLSASSLTQFLRCPEQWRRVRLQKERERPSAALVWGSADHGAHEVNFRQKIETGTDISEDDLALAFADQFDLAVEKNGGESEIDWADDKPGNMLDRGVALAATYHRQVSPTIQPLAVEERFLVELPGVAVPILGFVDVRAVVSNGSADGTRRLIERKTSGKRVSSLKPDWRLQGLLYQAVEELPVDWHLSVKTKTPAVYTPAEEAALTLPFTPTAVDTAKKMVANAARSLAAMYATFGPDDPWPGTVTYGWGCDYCGFRKSCAWWRYEQVAA